MANHIKPVRLPRPPAPGQEALWLADGRWQHRDPAGVCRSKSGHARVTTALGCEHNSQLIQWKRDRRG